ncbi:MAG: hypothetical protein Kow00127_03220 [Bacteroidales bacterium]
MLDDIASAVQYIYLETYRFNNDSIGIRFRDALVAAAKRGVEIKLLLDSWGTSLPSSFFQELNGNDVNAEVRYFQKIKFFWDFFTKNHRRNHRKLLIIDDKVTWIGSANISDYSLNWRESVLRVGSSITMRFKEIFLQHYDLYNKYVFEKLVTIEGIKEGNFEIVQDVPSLTRQRIRKRFIELIRSAREEILIETPYFLPSSSIRRAMTEAAGRGVKIEVVIPFHSDVGLVDLLRNRYLGPLSKAGVSFYLYGPHNLHAKLLMIDRRFFAVGSPNFDYRSFRFQHEIVLIGKQVTAAGQMYKHIKESMATSRKFDYSIWEKRSAISRFFEWLILPFRHLL